MWNPGDKKSLACILNMQSGDMNKGIFPYLFIYIYILFLFQFIPWKKRYFCLKSRDVQTEDEMIKLLDQKGLLELDAFPINLSRYSKQGIFNIKYLK